MDDHFDQYVEDQLGMARSSGITLDDMDFTKNVHIPGLTKKKSIHQMIDTCKDLLKHNKVSEAKVFYNQIRESYYGHAFPNQKEKEAVHNMIRTLYDEINLAEIGRNR